MADNFYVIKLYNTTGEVTAISRSLGFELYYNGTQKYPSAKIDYVPHYPSKIKNTKQKYKFIEAQIIAFELKRLKANQTAIIRREKARLKREEEKLKKLQQELADQLETEFVTLADLDEQKLNFEERERKEIIIPEQIIKYQLYSNKNRIRKTLFSQATRFKINHGFETVYSLTKFPEGQKVAQKKKFIKKMMKTLIEKNNFRIFESDEYVTVGRDKAVQTNKRWTLRYNEPEQFSLDNIEELENLKFRMYDDFEKLINFFWDDWVDKSEHDFIITILVGEHNEKGEFLERKVPFEFAEHHFGLEKMNRNLFFSSPPKSHIRKFWEDKGYEISKAKSSAAYDYIVYEPIQAIGRDILEKSRGIGSYRTTIFEKEELLDFFENGFFEGNDQETGFTTYMKNYLQRKFTELITVFGFSIELLLERVEPAGYRMNPKRKK